MLMAGERASVTWPSRALSSPVSSSSRQPFTARSCKGVAKVLFEGGRMPAAVALVRKDLDGKPMPSLVAAVRGARKPLYRPFELEQE